MPFNRARSGSPAPWLVSDTLKSVGRPQLARGPDFGHAWSIVDQCERIIRAITDRRPFRCSERPEEEEEEELCWTLEALVAFLEAVLICRVVFTS